MKRMLHKPHFFKKMKTPETPQPQNPEPEVTRETDERVANEAYIKAFGTVKTLFDASVQIDKKMSDGIEQVDKYWKRYIGVAVAIAVIAAYLGVPYLIKERVTEQYVGEAVQKQVASFTDDKVASMIEDSIKKAKEGVKEELEQINTASEELKTTILSVREETEELSAKLLESRDVIDVYEQIATARTGNRIAYDALRQLAQGSNRVSRIATLGIEEVNRTYELRKNTWGLGQEIWVDETTKQETIPVDVMMSIVFQDIDHSSAAAINSIVHKKHKQCVSIIVWAVAHSKYLDTVYAAIRGVEDLTGHPFPAMGIDEVLEWWEANKNDDDLNCEFAQYLTEKQKPEETFVDYNWRKAKLLSKWLDKETEQYQSANRLLALLTWLALRQDDEEKQENEILMQNALEYLEYEVPRKPYWYAYKTVYYALYDPDKMVDFVNDRLRDHPGFEDELRHWTGTFFNQYFFQMEQINWPSKSAASLEEVKTNTEKGLE